MRHRWDYSQYGQKHTDVGCRARRVCIVCGCEQKKHDKQWWGRVIGYRWDGDGRSPCPGPKGKK